MINAAGCVFTNEKLILAGYQPHKKKPMITGLGGKLNEGEDPIHAAWRETLEELFDWETVSEYILDFCIELIPIKILEDKSYVQYIYSFEVLERVLQECYSRGCSSELYTIFPFTLEELLFHRTSKGRVEVEQLALLPMDGQYIAKHFIRDIQKIKGNSEQCLLISSSDEE